MSLELRVAQVTDIEELLDFEDKKLKEMISDENERVFHMWHSRWRREALEHYLPNGWCFVAREGNDIMGYFIAQPMLFMDAQTQSLWVEHVQYSSLQTRDELCLLAYKVAREKHFQRIYYPNTKNILNAITALRPEEWGPQALMVKTSKA